MGIKLIYVFHPSTAKYRWFIEWEGDSKHPSDFFPYSIL